MWKCLSAALAVMSVFVAVQAHAANQTTIVTVETDAFAGSYFFDVVLSGEGEIQGLVYRSSQGEIRLPVAKLQTWQVLKKESGRDIILLRLESGFTPAKGGHAKLRFLQSGVSNTYKNFRMLIDNQGEIVLRSDPETRDPESDRNRYTTVFNHLFMRSNRLLGKITGIKSIEPSLR